jgi:predicted phage tail protein
MTSIYLHGELGRAIGEKWDLEVDSVAEAISAIEANTGKLINFIQEKIQDKIGYNIVVDEEEISEEEIVSKSPKKEIHITPAVEGSKGAAMKIIAGMVLIAAPYLAAAMAGAGGAATVGILGSTAAGAGAMSVYGSLSIVGNLAVSVGLSLVMGGITELMTKPPSMNESKQTQSFLFGGNVNNQVQGQAVPIGYGRLRVGSQVIGVSQRNSLLSEASYSEMIAKRKVMWKEAVNAWLQQTTEDYNYEVKNQTIAKTKTRGYRSWGSRNISLAEYRIAKRDMFVSSAQYSSGGNTSSRQSHGRIQYDFRVSRMAANVPNAFNPNL